LKRCQKGKVKERTEAQMMVAEALVNLHNESSIAGYSLDSKESTPIERQKSSHFQNGPTRSSSSIPEISSLPSSACSTAKTPMVTSNKSYRKRKYLQFLFFTRKTSQ
jgi:hypothetical protein